MRAYVYVDGFNMYYRALKGGPYKWLNLHEVAQCLLNPEDKVKCIRYFTARVSPRAGDPDAPRRQQILFNALKTLPTLKIHYGSFLPKIKRRPLVSNPKQFVDVHDTEEKGSDVNLATHLVNDAWHDRFDVALVVSQDTDLVEPMRIVRTERHKTVGLIWMDGRVPNKNMAGVASFVRHLKKADLAACQFPDPIHLKNGTTISKPAGW